MLHRCFLVLFIFVGFSTEAQDLMSFNEDRINLTQNGMVVLGAWATANIVVNPILARGKTGSIKYFYQMNAYWNVVNLAIAGIGYWSLNSADPNSFDLVSSLSEQQRIEKLLLFNAGLDVAYVLGGLYLHERAKNVEKNSDRLRGFGQAIMLQGAWLFTFDLIFYFYQRSNGQKLLGILDNLALSPFGFSATMNF